MAFQKFGELVGQYNTVFPNLADTQLTPLTTDINGRLYVVNSGVFAVQETGAALTALQLIDNLVLLEDALAASGDPGVQALAVRTDSPAPKAADGDYVPLLTDATGLLWARIGNASGASAVNIQDGGNSITIDNSTLSVVGGGTEATALRVTLANDSTGLVSVDDNGSSLTVDNAVLSVVGGGTEATAQRVTIASDSTGVLSVDDNGGSLTVDGTVAVSSITTSITPGTAATNLGKAESAGHTSGDVGVFALAVRNDAGTALASDLQYSPLQVDSTGALRISGSISVATFESGTEADTASDPGSGGDGLVAITDQLTELLSLSVGAGTTAYIMGWNGVADREALFVLEVRDNTTLVETVRLSATTQGNPSFNMPLNRAIQISGATNRAIKVKAKALNTTAAEAHAAVNVYTR